VNTALSPQTFVIAAITFITIVALVAQLTIQMLAGFKPRYLSALAAGVIGNIGAYFLGSLMSWGIARLRLTSRSPSSSS